MSGALVLGIDDARFAQNHKAERIVGMRLLCGIDSRNGHGFAGAHPIPSYNQSIPIQPNLPAMCNTTPTGNRWLRILTLCSLYISQGLPQGIIYIALKNHLYGQAFSLAAVGGILSQFF